MDQGHRMRSRKPSPLRLSDKGKLWAASLIVTGELPVGGQWLLMGMDGEGSSRLRSDQRGGPLTPSGCRPPCVHWGFLACQPANKS